MSTTFYEIYRLLCQKAGKSDNAVAAEIGLSNSTVTTWKQGALPRRPTLKKVADYFNVSTDYLMGSTIDAQIDVTESKLRNLRAALDFSDENEHGDLEQQLEVLEESYKDLCFAKGLTEKAPTQEGERSVAQTEDEEDMLLLARHMEPIPEEDRRQLKEQFKKSIDLYLKARGLSETEDK